MPAAASTPKCATTCCTSPWPCPTTRPCWPGAATPFKAQAGEVVFYTATQRVAHETIAFAAGQCVSYHETFESGAGRDGA